jgi:PAS domain S-box-containing protein
MPLALAPAHRLARINYAPRALAFAYTFLVLEALMLERGSSGWTLAFGALQFLVYPHLAYLHARVAPDSRRAELINLAFDAFTLGMWTAQAQFALWWSAGLLCAISLNSAANGGLRYLGLAWALFAAGAALWGALAGFSFSPYSGPLVTGLAIAGLIVYVSWVGTIMRQQNRAIARARGALHSSEDQFRFIAEHAGDLVAVLDRRGRIRYTSASHLDRFEPGMVAPGQDWVKLVHPDDRERARNFLQYLVMSRQMERMSLRLVPTTGPSLVIDCEGNPASDDSDGTGMLILVMRDITARVRTEMDLRLAAHAFDRVSDGVLISDGTGRIEYVNVAYCALTGYEPRDLVGRTTDEVRSGLTGDQHYQEIWRAVQRTGAWRGRFMEQRHDGKFFAASLVVSAVRDKEGASTHYVWVIADPAAPERVARSA